MKKRILWIESDFRNCNLIADILHDCEVKCAYSFADALRYASAGEFDLYLVDHFLPDGLEFILYVKSVNIETPILLVTGSPISESQAASIGAKGIIRQNSDLFVEDLRSQVSQHLK
jgi:DNA-binding response OmpR family regulator